MRNSKEKQQIYNRTYEKKYPLRLKLKLLKHKAKKKGLDFNITEEDLIAPEVCPILGIPLVRSSLPWSPSNPSVDRIDNSKGYVKGNTRVISFKANVAKGDLSLQEIENLYNYSKNLI